MRTLREHGAPISAEIMHAGQPHPIRVNIVPRGNITRIGRPRKFWDPTERRARIVRLSARTIEDAIAVLTDKRGFTYGLRIRNMSPPDWNDAIVSTAISYVYNTNLAEIDKHLSEARHKYARDQRTLTEIEKQFKDLKAELDAKYVSMGYSASDLRRIKANGAVLRKKQELVARLIAPRLKSAPSGATVVNRAALLGSPVNVLNVSYVSHTFPAVIAPSTPVSVTTVTDASGHTCDEWCFKETIPAVNFTFTLDLPDVPYAYLHVHDWWHWHDKWWDGYPHVHTHWHTGWIVMDIRFQFTTDIYFEICLSATGASIVVGGVACATVNGAQACCTVEASGVAGIRVVGSGTGSQGCEYGLGTNLTFSCEALGYDLPSVTIPLAGVTVKGPCVRQC